MSQTPKDVTFVERKMKLNNIQETILLSFFKFIPFFLYYFIKEEVEEFNNDNNQRMLYEINSFEEKLDFLYNNILNIQTKTRGQFI